MLIKTRAKPARFLGEPVLIKTRRAPPKKTKYNEQWGFVRAAGGGVGATAFYFTTHPEHVTYTYAFGIYV